MEPFKAVLERLGFEAPNLRSLPVDGSSDRNWAFDIDPATWFDTWQSLRNVVDDLGHWPLATCTYGLDFEMSTQLDRQGPDGLDVAPAAIIGRVPDVDVDGLLAGRREAAREQWLPDDEHLGYEVEEAALEGVDLARLRRELGIAPDLLDVERWLLDIELERGVRPNAYHNDAYLNWWVPGGPEEVAMLLVPTTVAWQVWAFVGGFEWGYPHTDLRPALLRRWHESYGVEPAANWGTTQQLVVRRPPATIEEAWNIAFEVDLTWPDTAGGGNGIATRWLAHDLVGRDNWFLHGRP